MTMKRRTFSSLYTLHSKSEQSLGSHIFISYAKWKDYIDLNKVKLPLKHVFFHSVFLKYRWSLF